MSTSFRFCKQLQLCEKIQSYQTQNELLQFVNEILNQFDCQQMQKFVVQSFLSNKSKFSDDMINYC